MILFLKKFGSVMQSKRLKKIDFNIVILLILSFMPIFLFLDKLNSSFGFPISYIFFEK